MARRMQYRKGMNDNDMVQTWKYTSKHRADDFAGEINTTTTERLDFTRMVVETHTVGIHEGERVNVRGSYPIDPICKGPEAAANYRRTHGYTRAS